MTVDDNNEMASRKPKDRDVSLPFAALQLLAPPVRLVSAALWKVLQQRDVMQYGVVEEFVTSACETVPGLLTTRHRAKLAFGLRARLILELCAVRPDVKVIQPHLERIHIPPASSAFAVKKDIKIVRTVEHFHAFVHTLLTEPAEREQFFKEEFPVEYGPVFDRELEKLLWEFLIRLDQLLPVPNLAQTVAWLSDAPPVLEECAQAATQPQLLEILLQHQTCLGHLEAAASLPPNMGDSILSSMSLPPSGRVRNPAMDLGKSLKLPVVGRSSHGDVPIMQTVQRFTSIKHKPEEDGGDADPHRSSRMKRRHPKEREESSEGEEEVVRLTKRTRQQAKRPSKFPDDSSDDEIPSTSAIRQPQRTSLNSIVTSCLNHQPRVVIRKLMVPATDAKGAAREVTLRQEKGASPVQGRHKQRRCPQTSDSESPGWDDKENLRMSPSGSGLGPQQRITAGETISHVNVGITNQPAKIKDET